MMEEVVRGMNNYITCGDELTEQVVDYLDDSDQAKALELLRVIDPRYWDGPAQVRASSSKHHGEVMARIIEHFGVNLDVFRHKGFSA